MRKSRIKTALMSALVAIAGVGLTVGSLTSCYNEEESYTVTYETSDVYTISIESGTSYNEGDTVEFTVTMTSSSYSLTSVYANDEALSGSTSSTSSNNYSFTMPSEDVVITVNYEEVEGENPDGGGEEEPVVPTTYTLTYQASDNDPEGLNVTFIDTDWSILSEAEEGTEIFVYISGLSDSTISSVKANGNEISKWGESSGDVAWYTFTMPASNVVVTIEWEEVEETDYSISQINDTNTVYTVRGVVVATNSSSFIIYDGEAGITVYGNNYAIYEIGDYLEVTGQVELSSYTNSYQFSYNTNPSITVLDASLAPTLTNEPIELTADIVNNNHKSGTISTTDVQLYTWTARVTSTGSYVEFSIDGIDDPYVMETPSGGIASNISVEYGATYRFEGYYCGYDGSKYIYYMITSAELVEAAPDTSVDYDSLDSYTVSELLEIDPSTTDLSTSSSEVLYKVTGIVTNISSSTSGRFYLADEETGETLYVYTCGDAETVFVHDDGIYNRQYTSNFADIGLEEGDKVTLVVMYGLYNTTVEAYGEYFETVATREENAVYSITDLPSYLTTEKTEGLIYGESVTLTLDEEAFAAAEPGQRLSSVSVNGNAITPDTSSGVTTYTFNVDILNVITVSLVSADAEIVPVTLTATNLGLGSSYSSSEQSLNIASESNTEISLDIMFANLMMNSSSNSIQLNSSRDSELWSTSGEYEISSIEFVPNTDVTLGQTSNPQYKVSFGTEAITDADNATSYTTVTVTQENVEVFSTLSDATYFNIIRTGSGASYLSSIIVNLIIG